MKKALTILLVIAVCLSLWACDQLPTESTNSVDTNGTEKPNLTLFDISGDWVIADEGSKKITFHEDGTCSIDGEGSTVYRLDEATAIVTIGDDAKTYKVEYSDGHYRLIGEHYILREDDTVKIAEIVAIEQVYALAVATLTAIDVEMPYRYPSWETMQQASAIYQSLLSIDGYKDVSQILSRFSHCRYEGAYPILWIYDIVGRPIGRFSTSSSGEYRTRYVTEYDENGNPTCITSTVCRNGNTSQVSSSYTTDYTYDESGKLIVENYTSGGPYYDYYTYRYEYDGNGRLTKKIMVVSSEYYAQGPSLYTYEYDADGKLHSEFEHGGNLDSIVYGSDVVTRKTVYHYNEAGQKIEEEIYRYDSAVGELVFSCSYQYAYSESGLLTKEITFNADGTSTETEYYEIYWYNGKSA